MPKRCFVFFALLLPVWEPPGVGPCCPSPNGLIRTGQLALRGLSVRFASIPAPEDRFTAERLAAALSTAAGVPIPIWEGAAQGKAIVLNRTGAVDPLPLPDEKAGPDSREAYSVKVTSQGAEIAARSSAGLYYGAVTLLQLMEGSGEQAALPVVELRDWPAFAYRAVMMDMSHGALPTEGEVKRQIDLLSRWKANQYYFYSETSIEMKGYPLLSHRARFTADQIARIVEYARERHVDVVPCVELYGHLHDLFRLEQFANLSVLPHGGEFNTRDPKTMAVITDWVDQIIGMFPSPYLHIGLDEPYELEKSAKLAGIPASKIYLDQLAKVAELVRQRGKHVVYWADAANIFGPHPEVLNALPAGITAVPWKNGYVRSYEPFLGPFAKLHVPAYASTSVLNYSQVAPDFSQTFNALDQLMADARKFQATGLLLTLWTDDGQVLMRTALPGLAYGMAACWQSTPVAGGFLLRLRTQGLSRGGGRGGGAGAHGDLGCGNAPAKRARIQLDGEVLGGSLHPREPEEHARASGGLPQAPAPVGSGAGPPAAGAVPGGRQGKHLEPTGGGAHARLRRPEAHLRRRDGRHLERAGRASEPPGRGLLQLGESRAKITPASPT